MLQEKVNITTIWWGKWTYNVLSWLKSNTDYNLASIISMADSWWSAWVLRDEFWILPPWDVRRAILALSDESELLRKLFEYRFDKSSSVSWHTVWNLLLTALTNITGDFWDWIREINKMFKVRGKIFPVTMDNAHICAKLEDWQVIIWENNIDIPEHNPNLKIEKLFYDKEISLNVNAENAIENSDIIILCPWDLYSSVVPNLIVPWMKQAIKNSWAKVVYFCNIMTKHWETTGFWTMDFIDTIEKYLWEWVLDYVIVNSWEIWEEIAKKYEEEESKKPVALENKDDFIWKRYKIIQRDLVNETNSAMHKPSKIAWVINDIIWWWIK